MYKRVHVKCPLYLSDFNETWISSTDFRKLLRYQISLIKTPWEPRFFMFGGGERTDMAKLIVAFRNFANASKILLYIGDWKSSLKWRQLCRNVGILNICSATHTSEVKGKVHPCTGTEALYKPYGPYGALEVGEGSASRPGRSLPPGKTWYHCTGGWVEPRAGLDRCGKSRPHRDSIPIQYIRSNLKIFQWFFFSDLVPLDCSLQYS